MPPQPQPQPQPQPADDDPNAPLDPGAAASLNTGEAADWGATWGPKGENYSVTTEVQPGPSIPAARPEGVAPFSLVPDPSSGEDLSFGTGVSIDDVKQNPAMAEFARRAAANRAAQAPQPAQPQQSQQAPEASQPGMDAQRNAAHPAQEHAQRQQAEREAQQRAAQEQAQREQAEREAQQRAAQEQAQREQAEREAQRRAAQEQAQREAQQRAAQEQAQRAAQQATAAVSPAASARRARRNPQGQQPAPQGAGLAGGDVPAGGTILQQLQGSSRVPSIPWWPTMAPWQASMAVHLPWRSATPAPS